MKISYKDKKSVIHRIHPASKILWAVGTVISSFLISDPIILMLIFLSTLPFVFFGRIIKEWSFFIKFALILSFLIIIINIFASQHGSHVIYKILSIPIIGNVKITLESLIFGFSMSLRLLSTISAFAIATLTINPDDLLNLIIKLKIPQRTVLTTTIATRFIPSLLGDIEKIQDSLKSRAYNMDERGFIRRLKKRAIILPPLISNSLDRSIQSAEAMESRGFGSKGKKTIYKSILTSRIDYLFFFLPLLIIFVTILFWIFGFGKYEYYPTIDTISITLNYVIFVSVFCFLLNSLVIFSPLKKVIDLD